GWMPWILRISQTVEGATLSPKMASSPWIFRYPQLGLSCATRRTRARMLRTVGRLPGRLGQDALAWRRRIRSRGQRRTVSGETIRWSCRRVGRGELVEQGSEERPVGRGESWFIDSALQDGELVA